MSMYNEPSVEAIYRMLEQHAHRNRGNAKAMLWVNRIRKLLDTAVDVADDRIAELEARLNRNPSDSFDWIGEWLDSIDIADYEDED